jgi:DamX protein
VAATAIVPTTPGANTASPSAPTGPGAQPAPRPSDAIAARLAAGRSLISDGSNAGFAVQLMVTDARERGYLENYLSEAGKAVQRDQLYLFPAGSPETPRLGVLIGGFRERGDALAALDNLPENLKQFRPYVRSIDGVREDVRRAERR